MNIATSDTNSFGKVIKIYLQDGNVSGVKWGEIVNCTIQSISCPRISTSGLIQYAEVRKPGVYVRLQDHIINKDFWNEVVLIISKDDNLTASHAKYLEARLIQIATAAKRYKIENANLSQPASLSRSEKDTMEEFLTFIRLLLGVLGHRVLDPITPGANTKSMPAAEHPVTLSLFMSKLQANALQTDEGIVVLQESQAALEMGSLSPGYRELRENLILNGILIKKDGSYIFQENTLFSAPSAAAAVILGYNANGLLAWKDHSGRTLKEIESDRITTVKNTP